MASWETIFGRRRSAGPLGQLLPCGGGPPIPLVKSKVVLGRSSSCDIQLPYSTVSGMHCELEYHDGFWSVRDLGSRNGLRVDGVPHQQCRLFPRARLEIAQCRFVIAYQAQQSPAPLACNQQAEPLRHRESSSSYRTTLGELDPCGGGHSIRLTKPTLIVGRSRECDIAVCDSTVSSRHCQLEFKNEYWFVTDLGSRNGVRVNGMPCQTRLLMPQDILGIARVRYVVAYTPPPDAVPPLVEVFAKSLLDKIAMPPGAPAAEP